MNYTVAVIDDHELVAKAIAGLIQKMDGYEVLFEAANGKELIRQINQNKVPDIALLDINMPEMDGYETAAWLRANHPEVKVLALSMNEKEESIVKMLRNGAKGYLLKGAKPSQLREAFDSIMTRGFYYTELITDKLVKSLNPDLSPVQAFHLTEREVQFLQLACTDFTYNEIAQKMNVSPRTIDGWRENVFEKLNVKTRVSMVVKALRLGIVQF